MLLLILFVFLSSWDTTIARYALVLEEAYNCLPNSRILLNYTYKKETQKGAGYVEFLENIEAHTNTLVSLGIQRKNPENILLFFNRDINITKADLCVQLNSDIIFLPYFRQFINLEKYCPINKGIYAIQRSIIYYKNMMFPFGCWKIEAVIQRAKRVLSCMHLTIQFLSSESKPDKTCS